MECSGLQNKPKAEVHLGHLLTGSKEEEEEVLLFQDAVQKDPIVRDKRRY
jgi:hypothetical protein